MAQWNMGKIMHGGDYNPDQWRHIPGILDEDMRLMQLARCNLMSVGIFSWSALEPQEGQYDFGWLDEVLDRIAVGGGKVFLATPSGARPAWMSQKYPEVLRVRPDGQRNFHGARHNHCYTSPVYREKVAQINEKLAQRYADHPALAGWHISNEYGGACWCPRCQEAFRQFLKEKYGDIQTLNHAYWADFWSHAYNDFDQVEAPGPYGEHSVDGLTLDWKRFVTHQTVDFMRHEVAAVRKYSDKPATANFMCIYPYDGLDYWKFRDVLDVVSWDLYPMWRGDSNDYAMAARTSFSQDVARSILGKPWLLMESTPSNTNWMEVCKLKRPGMHLLSSLQAVAHGADSVQYFQWRKSRGSAEKHHGAVVDHVGSEHTRVFQDVMQVGQALEKLDSVAGAQVRAQAAVIFDWDNRWAIQAAQGPRKDKQADETVFEHYFALRKCGVNVDVIDSQCDLSGYQLVAAPMLYLLKPGVAENIRKFVQKGGTFVATYLSGVTDENSLCFLGGTPGGGLGEVLGVWSEEIDALYPQDQNAVVFPDGRSYRCGFLCELSHLRTARALAVYGSDFYAGMPALTVNDFGAGQAYYIAARTEQAFLDDFYQKLTLEKQIERPAGNLAPLEEGVFVSQREKGTVKTIFVMNFSAQAKHVALKEKNYTDLLSGACVSGAVDLAPWDVRVLQYC